MRFYIPLIFAITLYSTKVQAYLGPGLGLGAIGAFFGIIFAVFLAIVGMFWYPLKRVYFRIRGIKTEPEDTEDEKDKSNEDNKSHSDGNSL